MSFFLIDYISRALHLNQVMSDSVPKTACGLMRPDILPILPLLPLGFELIERVLSVLLLLPPVVNIQKQGIQKYMIF